MSAEPAYRADGRPCSRERFYNLACDPERSTIIEACAGAGKTWMLVSRVLRALLDGAAPGEILAITFTRKAAGEMRSRLHEWLRDLAAATIDQRCTQLCERGLTAEQARRVEPELATLHARVLASGEEVQVHTFHAWFAQLLRLAPQESLEALGLHPAMALIEEVDDHLGELMRRFQRAVLDAPHLLLDYRTLTERHGRSRLERWLRSAIDKRLEIERADAHQTLQPAIEPAARRWPDCSAFGHPLERIVADQVLRRQLGAAARELAAQAGTKARDAAAGLAAALDLTDPRASYIAARQALFTKAGPPLRLGDLVTVGDATAALDRLQQQVAQQDAHDDHQRMVRLSRTLLACWRDLKRERSLIDMPDLERSAWALLSDAAASGWVQQRLDVQLRHVLIDEFQDTSNLQWQALAAWLSSYAGAGGGASGQRPLSVFIVGDPKQSIYRFRGAEPRVFDAARAFVVAGMSGHDLACNHSRRNANAVIDVVNRVFGDAAAAGDYPGFVAHSTERADGAAASLRHLPDAPPSAPPATPASVGWRDSLTQPRHEATEPRALDEARRVARAVAQRIRGEGIAPGEVMVLARKREPLALVAAALQALQVPCVAVEELRLGNVMEVRDLVAVLDVLASHGNDLSLAHALKSPLFAASDADLLALARRADRRTATPWWSALVQWTDAPPALARARACLSRWAIEAQHLPPHDLLDRIVHQGELMPRLAAAVPPQRREAALAAVDALLALSLSLDGGRHASVYRFVRALRQRALAVRAPARADAVQLLTVHGVKGLEARCVFVIDADPNERNESDPGVLVDWPVDHDAPRRVAFLVDPASPCPSLVDLRALEQAAARREELNALYVAMTRARDLLLFSRTVPRRGGPSGRASWWTRVLPHSRALSDDDAAAAVLDTDTADGWIADPPAAGADSVGAEPAPQAMPGAAAQLGRAVHRVLQWASVSRGRPDFEALAEAVVAEVELPLSAAAAAAAHARTMHDSAALRPFFDPSLVSWSADEFDVVLDGEVLRIDRLVRLGTAAASEWWVLDYKLALNAPADPALRRQLARYRAAVQAVVGGQTVRAAFIGGDGAVHELGPGA